MFSNILSDLLNWLLVLAHRVMRRCATGVILALPGAWQKVDGIVPPEQMTAFSVLICLWAVVGTVHSKRVADRTKPGKATQMSASAVLRVLSWLCRHLGG